MVQGLRNLTRKNWGRPILWSNYAGVKNKERGSNWNVLAYDKKGGG